MMDRQGWTERVEVANAPGGCPLCGGGLVVETTLFDDRYGYPGRFALSRCRDCGHRALKFDVSVDQVSALYTNYYPRSTFDVEQWAPPMEEALIVSWWCGLKASAFRWVPRNVRVLDIGCGFGESLGYHRDRGCDAHGVEADSNILRVAERHGLQVRVGLSDPSAYEPASFDVVTLDQVIEHITDPVSVLRGAHTVLKPEGTLVLSTPNAQGWGAWTFRQRWIHWHAPYHQQFFTCDSVRRAAAAAGLQVESIHTVTNSAWLGFQWCHVVAPAPEGQRSAFWNPKLPRSLMQRTLFGAVAVMDRLGINAALTRLFDALGLGDNLVFILRKPPAQ
jgi:2-polyprenyl-3-methyl-5-hydroxy-6-metoxy-1,4-benzoquinol methylase